MASCSCAIPPCSTSSAFLLSISLSSACSFRSFSSSSFCASSSDFSLFAARRALMAAMRSRASCSCLARSFSKLQQKQGYFVKTRSFRSSVKNYLERLRCYFICSVIGLKTSHPLLNQVLGEMGGGGEGEEKNKDGATPSVIHGSVE